MTAAAVATRRAMERAGPLPPACFPIPVNLLRTYTGGEDLHDIIDATYGLAVTFYQVAVGRYGVQTVGGDPVGKGSRLLVVRPRPQRSRERGVASVQEPLGPLYILGGGGGRGASPLLTVAQRYVRL